MPIGLKDNEFLMRCVCGGYHELMLTHDDEGSFGNNLKAEDDDWYFTVSLASSYGLWNRLWLAVRYVFNMRVPYGHYGNIVLKPEDVDALADFIRRRRRPQPSVAAGRFDPLSASSSTPAAERFADEDAAPRSTTEALNDRGADILKFPPDVIS